MNTHREKLTQLTDDFDWLEGHCRREPELARHAEHLHLAAALARNIIGGALEQQPPRPLHLAVVGGAGAGKSTVANFLAGTPIADANPQAGYTRHPTAYLPATGAMPWPSYLGFLGNLRKLTDTQPASLDEDVYQVQRIPAREGASEPLQDYIIWDCPDMTTWASSGYISRLMEVSALADVVVYVASDERYNDEVPTQYLQMLIEAGKAVIVCITKMREADATPMIEHFRKEVLAKRANENLSAIPPIPVLAIPNLTKEERADPAGAGAKYRIALINHVLALCPTLEEARERTVRNAVQYLEKASDNLLSIASNDLAELDHWKATVKAGRTQFEERYRREYLAGEPFKRFDRTREQLLGMLELPAGLRYLSAAFALLRAPYSYFREFLIKLAGTSEVPPLPEQAVLRTGFDAWIDTLRAEALKRGTGHPVWKQIANAFDAGLKNQALVPFEAAVRQFELKEGDELEQAGRSLTDRLAQQPMILGGVRFAKVSFDLLAIALVLWLTWLPSWYHLLLIPLAVSFTHQIFEWIVRGTVEAARFRARNKRESLLGAHLTGPVSEWLQAKPLSEGSSIERLQSVLRRVPENIRELAVIVKPHPATNAP